MSKTNSQIWNQFIIIKNLTQNQILSSLLKGYEGDNILGYIYIDHEEGITLDILKLFSENNGEFEIKKDLIKDKSRAILRFAQFTNIDFSIADIETLTKLETELPDYIKSYERMDLIDFRKEEKFKKFTAPGFPDDLQILLIKQNSKNKPEQIWGKVEEYDAIEKIGRAKLMVQPFQNLGINKGEKILFKLLEFNENESHPVSIIQPQSENTRVKKWWKFW